MADKKMTHEDPKVLCIGEIDMQQNDRISSIETQLKLMESSRGTLKLGEIGKLGSLMGFLFGLMTIISTMWINSKTEPTRSLLAASVQTQAQIQKDIIRLEGNIQTLKVEVTSLDEDLSATLDPEVLEQRFAAITQNIEGVEGRFERITTQRLQPLIQENRRHIADLEKYQIEELKRQRDE